MKLMAYIMTTSATSVPKHLSLRNGFMVPTDSCELHLAQKTEAQDR